MHAGAVWIDLIGRMRSTLLASGIAFDDRRVLESVILPFLARRADGARVLFVGCAWYTRAYERLFADAEFWTVDPDPRKRRHGAARHVVGSLVDIEARFGADSLDLIICNGVCGWGLDDPEEAERAMHACHRCLRAGGLLVFGWNDLPGRRPLRPEDSPSLRQFRPHVFPPLGVARLVTRSPRKHIYDFYEKS